MIFHAAAASHRPTIAIAGDCHNQCAHWFRNDVGFKKLPDKLKFDTG